jgi:hypothetical protein
MSSLHQPKQPVPHTNYGLFLTLHRGAESIVRH